MIAIDAFHNNESKTRENCSHQFNTTQFLLKVRRLCQIKMATMLEGLTKRFTAFYTFVDITTAESPNEDPKLHIVFWNMKEKKWLNCMEIEQVASQIDSAGKANIEVTLLTTIPIAFNHGVCVIYFPPRYVSIIILLIIKICNFHFFFFFEGKYFPSLKKKKSKNHIFNQTL